MTIQNIVTNHTRLSGLGGLSKSGVTPGGGDRAGCARNLAMASGNNDMIAKAHHKKKVTDRQ